MACSIILQREQYISATTDRDVNDDDILFFKEGLANLNRPTGFGWLLSEEPAAVSTMFYVAVLMLISHLLQTLNDKTVAHFLQETYSVDNEKERIGSILSLLCLDGTEQTSVLTLTKGQRNNQIW